jgi:hypothetical protein
MVCQKSGKPIKLCGAQFTESVVSKSKLRGLGRIKGVVASHGWRSMNLHEEISARDLEVKRIVLRGYASRTGPVKKGLILPLFLH